MPTIQEIRAAIAAQQSKNNTRASNAGGASATFPFWNIGFGDTATLRFVPDGNEKNPLFWVEKFAITLPFQGVVGQSEKEVKVTVPCMQTYKKACPITSEISSWWKTDMEPLAQKYYRKKQYLFHGFVVNSTLEEKEIPENPIRHFTISGKLFNIIQASLMDPEMDNSPVDFVGGVDFKLTKTKNGDWPDYTTSTWSRRSRDLSQDELDAIDRFGISDLSSRLPKEPTEEELGAIVEMFHASLNNEAYDPERWGNYYRPFGVDAPGRAAREDNIMDTDNVAAFKEKAATTKAAVTPKVTTKVEEVITADEDEEVPTPVEPVAATGEKQSAADIIAKLKAARAKSA